MGCAASCVAAAAVRTSRARGQSSSASRRSPRRRAGRVQQHAAASRGPGSTRARGARRRTGVRAGGAHGGGTGEELPTRRDRCATRRSCTCTSDEAEICYSAADSGCLCPVASRPVEAESRTATTGRRWWRAPGRCSRAGTRSRQDPGGHRGGEEKKGWRRQMTCGAVCQ